MAKSVNFTGGWVFAGLFRAAVAVSRAAGETVARRWSRPIPLLMDMSLGLPGPLAAGDDRRAYRIYLAAAGLVAMALLLTREKNGLRVHRAGGPASSS